jgi:hypothetical protein
MKITKSQFMAILGTAYSEVLDLKVLESEQMKVWNQRISDIIQYVLFNYFGVEVES